MQRHELVKQALKIGTPVNVTAGDIDKYWTIEDQEHAVVKTQMQIDIINNVIKSVKTLNEHEYPVDLITTEHIDVDVRIETPEKDSIGTTVKLSPKIATMINNLRGEEFYETARNDVLSYLSGVVDVLKVKRSAEKQHLCFLNEVV